MPLGARALHALAELLRRKAAHPFWPLSAVTDISSASRSPGNASGRRPGSTISAFMTFGAASPRSPYPAATASISLASARASSIPNHGTKIVPIAVKSVPLAVSQKCPKHCRANARLRIPSGLVSVEADQQILTSVVSLEVV
jgi:hypothetical protein